MAPASKIDVHAHFIPPNYRTACEEHGHSHPDGMPAVPPWTEQSQFEMMDALNITKSILSITSPGTHLVAGDDALARTVTRDCNVYAADMKKRYPARIGFFASTTLPDVQGTLEEIKFAFDELNADGVTVKTNHHGTYLGHADFEPVMRELDRRKAIVFIHPTTPCMPSGQHAVPLGQYPRPLFEFLFDSARAVINLFLSGTVERYPNITYILSHCGGALPPLIRRFSSAAPLMNLPGVGNINPDYVKERFRTQFLFDTAGWAFPEQVKGLLEYTTVDRILYGSDFPWTPLKFVTELSNDHDKYMPEVFEKPEEREALCHRNAARLLDRGQ